VHGRFRLAARPVDEEVGLSRQERFRGCGVAETG
jgi:hypothetical protein